MARPREFNPEQTLQTAITLFWQRGYYDTSVDEVIKHTGVAKYGIYGTFGNKRELFLKALKQYAQDRKQDIQAEVRKTDAALPEVIAFLKQTAKFVTDNNNSRGCLICNTGIELGLRDQEIREFVEEFFTDLTQVLEACLKRAIQKQQLNTDKAPSRLAKYLCTEFRAALMLAASGVARHDIEQHIDTALLILAD